MQIAKEKTYPTNNERQTRRMEELYDLYKAVYEKPKRITFLIGNGFDLSCGLKSSYTDMYEGYVNSISNSPTIAQFKDRIQADIATWADFEMKMCDYMKEFSDEREFLECLHDFRNYMTEHLRSEEKKFRKKLNKRLKERVQVVVYESLFDICHIAFPDERDSQVRFSVICFNYTSVVDLVLVNPRVSEIVHVHGTLSDSPVMGVNDEGQFGSAIPYPITDDIKTEYVKPVFNQEYDQVRDEKAMNMIRNSDAICVFGMSLGASDKRWVEALADWHNTHWKDKLIIFDYGCYAKSDHKATNIRNAKKARQSLACKANWSRINEVEFEIQKPIFDFSFLLDEKLNIKKMKFRCIISCVWFLMSVCSIFALLLLKTHNIIVPPISILILCLGLFSYSLIASCVFFSYSVSKLLASKPRD